ncbi:glycosyltransferase 87 family protein [Actinomadura opuntiae]|uniref:glycosyltransferase 87 family protein n=1 Tax=Actinomadura sp. OS1-43 TaxID=604315 RepID=UPI00255A83F9|nr:glycosyltransferase 87 family protein [Actinomadura sp. OS1-43]MDL4816847.1 glycosyltransferase 87 family protein [Actinomadura sp. OS1-43]
MRGVSGTRDEAGRPGSAPPEVPPPGAARAGAGRRSVLDALIMLAGVAVAVAAVTPIVSRRLYNQPDQRLVDLEVYREGGLAALRGAPLYDFLTQPPQLLPFTYPPFAAVLAVPFTLLSWRAAQWAWTALIYVALAIAVWYAFRDLIRRTGRWAPLTTGVLVAAMAWLDPVRDQIRFGQVGLFLLAMCLADCCTRSARWPRGLLVGLALAIKLVPGVFLVWFLITGRRDAFVNALVTAVAVTLGAFTVLPHDSAAYWFGALLQGGDRTGAVDGTTNQAINGIVARIIDQGAARTAVWLVLALVMAYYGFGLARRTTYAADALAGARPAATGRIGADHCAAADPRSGAGAYSLLLAGVAITGLLSVLLSPVGWIHHLVWMIPVIGALAGDGRDTRRCLSGLAIWIFFLFPLPWWGAHLSGPGRAPIARFWGSLERDSFGLAAIVSVLVLGIWLTNRLTRQIGREDPSHREAEVGTLAT